MRLSALFLALSLVSCATTKSSNGVVDQNDSAVLAVKKRAAFDMSCPEESITVIQLQEGGMMTAASYGAKGCDKSASYIERMGTVIKQ